MIKSTKILSVIDDTYISKALILFETQIKNQSHTYKNLDFSIYRQAPVPTLEEIKASLKNDYFYNNFGHFFKLDYVAPKGIGGTRRFNYLSRKLLITYYAIGFYINDLLKDRIKRFRILTNENFKTYYAFSLNYEFPEKSTIFYQPDYKDFNAHINGLVKRSIESNKKLVVLSFDIQSFFESIDHKKLWSIITDYVNPVEVEGKFSVEHASAIEDFLRLIGVDHTSKGLPVAAQNIISSFLSDIYLWKLDDFIKENILKYFSNSSYFRYVDDFCIMVQYDSEPVAYELNMLSITIERQLSNFLSSELKLKLNTSKSKIDWIFNANQAEDFIRKEKLISFSEIREKFSYSTISEHFNAIASAIDNNKDKFMEGAFKVETTDEILLNSCFEHSIKQYLLAPIAKDKLRLIFGDLPMPVLFMSKKALLFLMLSIDEGYSILKNHISIEIGKVMNPHLESLMEAAILSESYDGFLNNYLHKERITNKSKYAMIMSFYVEKKIELKGSLIDLGPDIDNEAIYDQIKLLRIAYFTADYNRSINHLVNVFQTYCYIKYNKNNIIEKDYTAAVIVENLREKLTKEQLGFIDRIFSMRHSNSISHTSSNGMTFTKINREKFIECMNKINELIRI